MDTSTAVVRIDKTQAREVARRLRPLSEKLRIVAEASMPGASVAEVARRHGLNANLVFGWRRQHQQGVLERHTRKTKLLPVAVSESPASAPAPQSPESGRISDEGRIEIILAEEMRITIVGAVAVEHIAQVLSILRRAS